MSTLQKAAIWACCLLMLAAGFWAGQDYAKFSDKWNRCIAYGGDGLTTGKLECFKRQAVAVPQS